MPTRSGLWPAHPRRSRSAQGVCRYGIGRGVYGSRPKKSKNPTIGAAHAAGSRAGQVGEGARLGRCRGGQAHDHGCDRKGEEIVTPSCAKPDAGRAANPAFALRTEGRIRPRRAQAAAAPARTSRAVTSRRCGSRGHAMMCHSGPGLNEPATPALTTLKPFIIQMPAWPLSFCHRMSEHESPL